VIGGGFEGRSCTVEYLLGRSPPLDLSVVRHQQLDAHLADFVSAYTFGRRLKTLRSLTPYEFICKT
jgi:hypothetical protein